jgi:hypothetical protein
MGMRRRTLDHNLIQSIDCGGSGFANRGVICDHALELFGEQGDLARAWCDRKPTC